MHILNTSICRLCGTTNLKYLYTLNNVNVERCDCGFVQVQNEPTKKQLEDFYSSDYFKNRASKYNDAVTLEREINRRLKFIETQGIADGSKMLEVGCATGDFIQFAKNKYDVWGIDISAYAIEQAKVKNMDVKDRLSAGLVEDQSFDEAMFDVIVMWDVVEHLYNPVEAFDQLLRTLKPGGHLFLSTPNIGAYIAKCMGKYWSLMTVPEHLIFLNRNTMRVFLENNLNLEMTDWNTSGKWANLGFLVYKLKKMFPKLVSDSLVKSVQGSFLNKISIYVPTGDIQYAAAIKK